MNDVLEVLTDAHYILSDRARWTQRANARNSEGIYVKPTSSKATQWCLLGCMIALCASQYSLYNRCVMALGPSAIDILRINDREGHIEVLRTLERAIRRLDPPAVTLRSERVVAA